MFVHRIFVALLLSVALFGCQQGGETQADPGSSPITLQDVNGLVFLSLGECPSGPGWKPVEGYTGRLIAVDDAVTGEPSTTDANPNDLIVNLRAPCHGKGRLGVADAPNSTQDPKGGVLCDTSRKKGAHTHDQVGFRLCRVELD
jgi:hypothetical protein